MFHLLRMNWKLSFGKGRLWATLIFTLLVVVVPIVLITYVIPEEHIDNFTAFIDRFFAEVVTLLFLAYMAAQMAVSDYKTGYIKNIVNTTASRLPIFAAKLLVNSVCFVIFVMLVQVVVAYIGYLILVPSFTFGDLGHFARILFLQTFLGSAVSAVVLMLGIVFKKSVPTYICATFLCTGTYETVLSAINMVQTWVWKRTLFDFTQLGIAQQAGNLPETQTSMTFIVLLCVGYFGLSATVGGLQIQSQDI